MVRIIAVGACVLSVAATLVAGCQSETSLIDEPIAAYRDRMLVEPAAAPAVPEGQREEAVARAERRPVAQLAGSTQAQTQRESLMTQPYAASQPAPQDVLAEIPDPADARRVLEERLERLRERTREERIANKYARVAENALKYLERVRRAEPLRLSLAECIQRALENNYTIRIEAYNPVIDRTRLVEAEAAFDAEFFLDFTYTNIDQPTASTLAGNQTDVRTYGGGIRQLLPTGMQVQVGLEQQRTFTDLAFQTINPAYQSTFSATLTQPLLRGFGLDVNRAQIELRRADLKISREAFVQTVRETIFNVEQAYWRLAQARRAATIVAEAVAFNEETYNSMWQRRIHDATPVELNNSRSRWQSRLTQYLDAVRQVRDAEDALKNLLNDADLLLSREIEIVPTQTPLVAPMAVDHFAEVRTAVDERSEIRQARFGVEQARIQTAVAKNQTLPQLDLNFQYDVQGLDVSADVSFDRMTSNRFRSYTVSVNFAWPIGNRAARAAWQRARSQEHQAVVAVQRAIDNVVLEVNNAVRNLVLRYEQIPSQMDSVQAAAENLRALQARTQRIDPPYLETELSAIEQLVSQRTNLLSVITEYNIAVVDLERSKGTLLDYNNIVVAEEPRSP